MALPRVAGDLGAVREGCCVVASVTLGQRDETDAAMLVLVVVPSDEGCDPVPGRSLM